MHDRHDRDDMLDEIPVADAIAQQQETVPTPTSPDWTDPPMEADVRDWQEQLQEVAAVDDDHEEYR